ncbi:tRNA (adenosine(37)-N6)-threonylcarbamoyltransferase complex dimerization subunit type 1 TsaB [Microlunatus capsulatus]|uniref:tRNA threonylcarbamoyl adenosine modification protein YeaZ n=1 Tax=Microlunatus capsulatus TaxID=99117 RepID=A0ABS4Z673_9ACTN|nr:tRNA (adenosine(37)-N6)-threonylcarbamoyltransferase complex dimerization subunit type 1 TsaB [Microlunatus capsulatus]MBP2416496.1 tRNA threonylcarbamoyl adenosine modification protein YeaZ [Microlunatus capsulatus]
MAEPLVLALDTSTTVAVGLARGGEVLGTAGVADRRAHVEQLTPLVQRCLADAGLRPADVDQLVVGLGPGPFTGLRVGIVTAQVLASALRRPWRGVCSLDVLARQHVLEHRDADDVGRAFVVATDARRREVYWARYDADGTRVEGPRVSAPGEVPRLPVVGPAADLYPDLLDGVLGPRTLDAGVLAAHGPDLPDAGREPLYLRRPDAAEPTRRKSVLLPRGPR